MNEPVGMTCLYKDGKSKEFTPEQIEAGMKDGWKDTPQAVAPVAPAIVKPVENKLDPKRP